MSAVHGPMPCRATSARMRVVGLALRQRVEVEPALGDLGRDRLDGLDLGPRQPEPRQPCRPRPPQRVVMERIEGAAQAGRRSRSRWRSKLLRADDDGEPGEAALAPAQRSAGRQWSSAACRARIGRDQIAQARMRDRLRLWRSVGHRTFGVASAVSGKADQKPQCRNPFSVSRRRPNGLSASRPCAVGLAEFRHGARGRAGASCCGSRTSIFRAVSRNTSRRSTRTSPGSA